MEVENSISLNSSLLAGQTLDEQLLVRPENWEKQLKPNLLSIIYAAIISPISEGLQNEIAITELETTLEVENVHSIDDLARQIIDTATSSFSNYYDQHPEWHEHHSLIRFIYVVFDAINIGLENTERALDSANLLDDTHCLLLSNLREACHIRLNEFSEGFGFSDDMSIEHLTEQLFEQDDEQFIDDSIYNQLLS